MNVTGSLTPDATCNYVYAGDHNGRTYFRRLDSAWFLWWDPAGAWNLTDELGVPFEDWWVREDPDIEGIYFPWGGAVGDATVAAGEH